MLCVNSNDTSKVICPDWVFFSFVSISNLNTCLSDLRDTVDWGKKWLVDFNARKTWLVSIEGQTNYATTNHLLPPPITSQNISTTTHKHPKMGYHLLKTKIYSYITSFWHFNSFFFCKMHYSFPWRRSCMLSFDQFVFQIQYFYDILHI